MSLERACAGILDRAMPSPLLWYKGAGGAELAPASVSRGQRRRWRWEQKSGEEGGEPGRRPGGGAQSLSLWPEAIHPVGALA